MPLNIIIGILALVAALVLYSIGVFGGVRAKAVGKRHIMFIWIGFVFDVLATSMMVIQAGGLQNDLHTALALMAMFGMLAAAIGGTWANLKSKNIVRAFIARWALVPWVIWVFVFIWGMVTRGAVRIGH